jgi:hypothetical protein
MVRYTDTVRQDGRFFVKTVSKTAAASRGSKFPIPSPACDKTATVNLNDKGDMTGNSDALAKNPSIGNLLNGSLNKIGLPSAITDATHPPLTIYFDDNSMEDLWMAVSWGT